MRAASVVLLSAVLLASLASLALQVRHARRHQFGPPCCGPCRCGHGCRCCPEAPTPAPGPEKGVRVPAMPHADGEPAAPVRRLSDEGLRANGPAPVGERWIMPRADSHAYRVFADMLRGE